MTIYPNLILEALKNVRYPGNGKNIVELGMVEDDIRIAGNRVEFSLKFDKATDPFIKSVVKSAETAILTYISPDVDIRGNIAVITPHPTPRTPHPILPGVKNIIGVSSGKGGVGKSTVASNLAVSLARLGFKVGLLDADIFGPSVPKMFGVEDEQLYMRNVNGRDLIIPAERYGVKLLSIGFMVDKNKPVLWRGSMASNALNQLITQADWGELDYFVIDMPPGTSDIHLTLVQTLGLTGVVVVSTPQEVALADARKGIAMFLDPKVNVPVLGLVENMAWFTPLRHPDEKYYLFGQEGAKRLAEELGVALLGQIPIVEDICQHSDSGEPIALADSPEGIAFIQLAGNVRDAVNQRNASLPPTEKVKVN
ncbi:MAG: Mrp/NBP35 family ATP-binding protein [Bacteroides sp.]|nr:Mrp/NBP35 family ATP-binding protein [Bacteroides sp.]MCM1379515.1 Mrp/NBP35 family ATP-binding protein [Bacteroides sp.]MCM1445882.1 Mrp/NBP35 family ATP-binding protein [Prevotella sp.]